MHGICSQRNDGIKIAEHGKAENGIDSNVITECNGDSDGRTGGIHVGGVVADDCSQVAMVGSIKVGGIADGTTKFNRFKGVRVIKGNELSNEVGPLRHEPEVE
jgi:hypothetical protein